MRQFHRVPLLLCTALATSLTAAPALAQDAAARENSREALLDAASALMRELDTTEIGIVDIAARAGVNHAMIRYFFGSKEGLLMALLDRDVTRRIRQLGRLFHLAVPT